MTFFYKEIITFKIFTYIFSFQGRNIWLLRITIEIVGTLQWKLEIYRSVLHITDKHTHICYYKLAKIRANSDLCEMKKICMYIYENSRTYGALETK